MAKSVGSSVGHALVALGAAAAVVAAGAAPASAHTPDRTVRVLSDNHGFTVSDRAVSAGPVTFRFRSTAALDASGNGGSDVEIFRLRPGVTVGQLISHIQDQGGAEQGPPTAAQLATAAGSTRWLTSHVQVFGGAAILGSGSAETVVSMSAGDYTLLDVNAVFAAISTHVAPTARHLRVYGHAPRQQALLPRIAGTIDTTTDDRFKVTSTWLAQGNYLIRNTSDTLHFVAFSPVRPGTTDATIARSVAAISAGQPPTADPSDPSRTAVQSGVLSPGRQLVLHSSLLKPGTYDLECFIADDSTGMPHFFMGMHKIVHIS